MLPLAPIAVALATKFIPELIGQALDSKKAEDITKTVVNTAIAEFPADAKDPKRALAKYEAMLDRKPVLQEDLRADVLEIIKLQVEDVQDARDKFKDDDRTAQLGMIVMLGSLPMIVAGIGGIAYLTTMDLDGSVIGTVSALIGAGLNQLYQERQQVMGYRFGSSIKKN